MFTDGSVLRQRRSKVSGGGACAQLRWWAPFDFKPIFLNFAYNITNQAANLKLSHTITILTNVRDSPNRTILKCSFGCFLTSLIHLLKLLPRCVWHAGWLLNQQFVIQPLLTLTQLFSEWVHVENRRFQLIWLQSVSESEKLIPLGPQRGSLTAGPLCIAQPVQPIATPLCSVTFIVMTVSKTFPY